MGNKSVPMGRDKGQNTGSATFSHGGSPGLGSGSFGHSTSMTRSMPSVMTGGGQVFTDIGYYKGVVVAIKHIRKDHLQMTRQVLMEFNEVRRPAHEKSLNFVNAIHFNEKE